MYYLNFLRYACQAIIGIDSPLQHKLVLAQTSLDELPHFKKRFIQASLLRFLNQSGCGNLGKYPVTTGIWPGVFMPESLGGLDPSHLTLASRLSKFGYRTGHIGKWHLGVGEHQKYLPTRLSI